jgi:hypothetical protein
MVRLTIRLFVLFLTVASTAWFFMLIGCKSEIDIACVQASTDCLQLADGSPEANVVLHKDDEWTRSYKEDDIEIFYQAEKVGTNKFEVKIKVVNNRSKAIRVQTRIKMKNASFEPVLAPSPRMEKGIEKGTKVYRDSCVLAVPAHGVTICEGLKVSGEKISGVSLIRWVNEDVAKDEDEREQRVRDSWLPPRSRKP